MTRKPVIAVSTRLELETNRFYLGRDYSEALQAAGAIPLMVPLIADASYIDSVVASSDGILLPGSDTDVDPLRFAEEPKPGLKKVIPVKEETDILMLESAERFGKSVFGICFGMQILNVHRGGTLYQDIERELPECVRHEQGQPLARGSHTIVVEAGSTLSRLITTGDSAVVNSHHHQGVRDVGRGLRVSARSRDGLAECIEEVGGGRFVMGVQWHPELSWRDDELSRNLFEYFVKSCRNLD